MTDHPDLTLVLDPSELWPDPAACPDWPLSLDMTGRNVSVGASRDEAAARLRQIHRFLHDGASTRAPTPAERADLRQRYFRTGTRVNWRWDALNLADTVPASPDVSDRAELLVQAAHVRGYLRKLDTAAETERERAEAARLETLRRRVDGAPGVLAGLEAQLAELAEAEARHLQRIEDERAAARARELRHQIDGVKAEAAQAARVLDAA